MGQVWKQACEGMITTQKCSKHNLDKYVYVGYVCDQKGPKNIIDKLCVSMCVCVPLKNALKQIWTSMCRFLYVG